MLNCPVVYMFNFSKTATMISLKKVFLVLMCSLIYINSFSQFTLVPGQPENKNLSQIFPIDDNLLFLTYHIQNSGESLYKYDGNTIEEIDFGITGAYFLYIGTLNNRYYFNSSSDPFLYEYNRETNETTSLPLPTGSYGWFSGICTMNGKLYFFGDILQPFMSYDGNSFETIPKPAPPEYLYKKLYYSSSQNLLYLIYRDDYQNASKLYTYDGTDFNEIQFDEDLMMASFLGEFDSKVIITGGDRNNYYDNQIYSCDGNTLTHITPGENTVFDLASYINKEDKRYYNFTNINRDERYLYEYDGTNLSLITSTPEHGSGLFLSEFNGLDYFTIYKNDTGKHSLYSYDGANLTEIEGEETERPIDFEGILDNKLYTTYYMENPPHFLTSYSSGDTQVVPIPNLPDFSIRMGIPISFQNMLIHVYEISHYPDAEFKYYAMTSSNEFFELQVPGYDVAQYEFMSGNKLYFSFYNQTTYNSKLFSWDGSRLDIPENESSKKEVVVFPNPAKDNLTVQLLNSSNTGEILLNLYSMDGKEMGSYQFKNNSSQFDFSISHLGKGMYIVEIINDSGSTSKKFIKN